MRLPSVRATRLTLLGIVLGAALSLLGAGTAQAHASVVSSNPAADTIVDTEPETVAIEFSEPVSVVAADTMVVDPRGEPASTEVSEEGATVRYKLDEDLPKGTYLVTYRVISADGHPIPGGYTFSIGERSETPDSAAALPASDPLVAGLVVVNRYLGYLGVAAAGGAALLMLTGHAPRGATRLLTVGLSTVAATAVLGLYLHVPFTTGTGLFDITGDDVGATLASRFGGASMIRLLLVLTLLPLLRLALTRSSRPLTGALLVGGVALAGTWPFAGHATTSPAPALTVLSDTLHLGAMALWAGGLAVLAFFGLRAAHAKTTAEFLPRWSYWASWLVGTLAVAGLSQALIHIGTPSSLVTTGYGWLVLAKTVLFAGLLGVAALARRRVAEGTGELVARVRRLVGVELLLAVSIMAVSAVLVQLVPGSSAEADSTPIPRAQVESETLETDQFTLRFELEPATVGTNTVHAYVFEPDGTTPLEPQEWRASYQGEGLAPVDIDLDQLSSHHSTADISIPREGEWEFVFQIRTSKFDRETVETTVSVT